MSRTALCLFSFFLFQVFFVGATTTFITVLTWFTYAA